MNTMHIPHSARVQKRGCKRSKEPEFNYLITPVATPPFVSQTVPAGHGRSLTNKVDQASLWSSGGMTRPISDGVQK